MKNFQDTFSIVKLQINKFLHLIPLPILFLYPLKMKDKKKKRYPNGKEEEKFSVH